MYQVKYVSYILRLSSTYSVHQEAIDQHLYNNLKELEVYLNTRNVPTSLNVSCA